jgi:hypothetical protein
MTTYIIVCADRVAATADSICEQSPIEMSLCVRYGMVDATDTVATRQMCRAALKSI